MQDKDILNFWSWFIKNASSLQSDNYDKTLLNELDKIISSWGLVWEVGPGLSKENSLTISPNGDKKLLYKTKNIIDKAPQLDNWEFYSTKQSKKNWHLAKLVDTNFEIDASDWTYVLLKYEDQKIEILLKADSLASLDNETKELAVDLILTNLLGEKLKIQKIDFVDVVDKFDDEKGITELKYLPAHLTDKNEFEQLWESSHYKKFPEIVCTHDILWGQPRLDGRRLAVGDIVSLVDTYHEDINVVLTDFELSLQQVRQALHYCKDLECKKDNPENFCHNCLLRVEQFNETIDKDDPEQSNWLRADKLFKEHFKTSS